MFKKTKLIVALALTLVICFAGITPARAEPPESKKAAITKVLKFPYGTVVTDMKFTFYVEAIEADKELYNAQPASQKMPILGTITQETPHATGEFTLTFSGNAFPEPDGNGTVSWSKQTPNLFDTKNVNWPHAGEYLYLITELKSGYNKTDKENIVYSGAKYTLIVLVKEEAGVLVINSVIARVEEIDVEGDIGAKIDPDPGDAINTFSKMTFTNLYWKHTGSTTPTGPGSPLETPDPGKPNRPYKNWTLFVNKVVDGDLANKELYFDFSITVNAPSVIPTVQRPTYYACIVNKNADNTYVVVGNPSPNDVGTSAIFTVTQGTPMSFKLKHNQYLVFLNTTVGATYTVTEVHPGDLYIPTAKVTKNSVTSGVAGSPTGADKTDLLLPGKYAAAVGSILYVGEDNSSANFTNTRSSSATTGLNLDDLPFIGLIALGLGALIVFIVVKARKNKHYN